jgi:hypothetical protein
MLPVGLNMLKTGRLDPMGLFGSHGIKGKSDLQKMLKKAREIEDKRKQLV